MNAARRPLIVAVFCAALAMRCWGLHWGLPERMDLHPDETDYVIKHAAGVYAHVAEAIKGVTPFNQGTLDPGFLNYPSFLMYLTAGFTALARALHLLPGEPQDFYLVGRVISATFGAATSIAAFLLAQELGLTLVGALLAALWIAVMPLHVWESHVAVTDIMMTFWVTVTLWASVRLLRTSRWRDFALAGGALGLAVGSKYTAALAAVAILLAAVWVEGTPGYKIKGLAIAAAVSLAACFLVTPYSFIRFPDVLAAMRYEHAHTVGHHFGFSLPAAGPHYHKYVYQLVAAWPFSMGVALYACAGIGSLWTLVRADRRHIILLGFAAVFFGITGHWTFTPLRYYMPILVVGAVFAAVWQDEWLSWAPRAARLVTIVAIAAAALYTLVFTAQTTNRFRHDTRVEAGTWIANHARPGSKMLLCGWHRYMGVPADTNRVLVSEGDERSFWLLDRHAEIDLIQISSLLYDRHYRHDNKPYKEAYDRLRGSDEFALVQRFESHFLNKRLYAALDPMFEGYFISPTIELYGPAGRRAGEEQRSL